MTDLRHFDAQEEFTAIEAAALIAGFDPNDPAAPQHLAVPALARLTEAYKHARRQCSQPMTGDEFKAWRSTAAFAHALASVRVECYVFNQKQPLWVRPRLVGTDPRIDLCGPLPPGINGFYVEPGREWELPKLFQGEYGDLEQQRFTRAELLRWLAAIDLNSVYDFARATGAARQAEVQEVVLANDVKAETVEERRARLLLWFEEEQRVKMHGALRRVVDRELAIRPTADRSNVGKDIQKAREKRDEFRRAGALPQVPRI